MRIAHLPVVSTLFLYFCCFCLPVTKNALTPDMIAKIPSTIYTKPFLSHLLYVV